MTFESDLDKKHSHRLGKIVKPEILQALGIHPQDNTGSFMILLEGVDTDVAIAHVADATLTRPNLVVVETTERSVTGEVIGASWRFITIPGLSYGEMVRMRPRPEAEIASYLDRLRHSIEDINTIDESIIEGRLQSYVNGVPSST